MSNLNQMKAFNKRSSWLVKSIEQENIKNKTNFIEFQRDFDGKTQTYHITIMNNIVLVRQQQPQQEIKQQQQK